MEEIKYLVNGVEKDITIFNLYKRLLEKHQVSHTLIKMYNQVFLNFDEYTFLHSIYDCHSNINKRFYFVNDISFDEDTFLNRLNLFTKRNYNYIYSYKRIYIDHENVSISQRLERVS